MKFKGWNRIGAALCILLLCTSARAAVPDLSPEIVSTLDTQGWVRVIVMFGQPPGLVFERDRPDSERIDQIRTVREQLLSDLGGQIVPKRAFLLIPGFAAEVNPSALKRLQAHPLVRRIELDLPGSGNMAEGGPLANIPAINAAGLTGAGVKIAIVDSGIDTDHPDFAGRIVAQQCMCSDGEGEVGCCPNDLETQSGEGAAEDDQRQSGQNGTEGVEDAQRAVADGQECEGEDQGLAETHPVGSGAGEEGHQVDPASEEARDHAGLDVVEADHTDEIGAEGNESAVISSSLAQLGGITGPEGARKTPG